MNELTRETYIDRSVEPSWCTPTNEAQKKAPFRVGIALIIGVFCWLGSYLGLVGVLVPAKIAEIAPAEKATILATMSGLAMVVSTIANIIYGAVSDRTRSRYGRRTPWIIFGSVGTCLTILLWGSVNTVTGIIVCAGLYQVFLNAIVAPMIAVLADRTAPQHRGMISSMYAVGNSTGAYGGQIIASFFLSSSYTGFIIMAVLALASGPVAACIMREGPSLDMPISDLKKGGLVRQFSFPVKNARDYYLALFGKLMILTSKYVIAGYQLYILTDYISLNAVQSAKYIGIISLCLLGTSLTMSVISGPVVDKIKMRKWPVVVSGFIIAIGCFLPSVAATPDLLIAYGIIAGIGMGIFSSVDQALNIEVLPDPKAAAKDLGILNIANNGSQILGPVIASIMINVVGYHALFIGASVAAMLGAILIACIRKG